MSGIRVRPYSGADQAPWDAFCSDAYMATFLHTRRFLSYHGERFADLSLVLEDRDRWLGLLPAARHEELHDVVVSHPGATYGGVIHCGRLRGAAMIEAMGRIAQHYAGLGFRKFLYKPVPHIHHRSPAEDDLYALFRLGARLVRCELSSVVDIANRLKPSERRRRNLKKARAAGVEVATGERYAGQLWEVVTENLSRKHGLRPAHKLAEMLLLKNRFPDKIEFVAGLLAARVVAGVVLFASARTHHAQYTATSIDGGRFGALDAVFEFCIERARSEQMRYFSFGVSTEMEGRVLNEGLFRFKSEFGSGSVAQEFHELALTA